MIASGACRVYRRVWRELVEHRPTPTLADRLFVVISLISSLSSNLYLSHPIYSSPPLLQFHSSHHVLLFTYKPLLRLRHLLPYRSCLVLHHLHSLAPAEHYAPYTVSFILPFFPTLPSPTCKDLTPSYPNYPFIMFKGRGIGELGQI